jgi:hypothetical protein
MSQSESFMFTPFPVTYVSVRFLHWFSPFYPQGLSTPDMGVAPNLNLQTKQKSGLRTDSFEGVALSGRRAVVFLLAVIIVCVGKTEIAILVR